MKIRVGQYEIGIEITQKMVCPAGTAYHVIDYTYRGVCIHSASTGAIYGKPNPISMLDQTYTINEEHYQDVDHPDPQPHGYNPAERTIKVGSINGRPAWWEEKDKTHRQAIIEAMAQIITEEAA